MKKLILLLFMLVYTIGISAQEEFTLRVYNVNFSEINQVYEDGEFVNEYEVMEYFESDFLAVIDLQQSIVKFGNEANTVYFLQGEPINVRKVDDNDGDETTVFTFNAIDEENLRCEVMLRTWEEYTLTQIIAEYTDLLIIYNCKLEK